MSAVTKREEPTDRCAVLLEPLDAVPATGSAIGEGPAGDADLVRSSWRRPCVRGRRHRRSPAGAAVAARAWRCTSRRESDVGREVGRRQVEAGRRRHAVGRHRPARDRSDVVLGATRRRRGQGRWFGVPGTSCSVPRTSRPVRRSRTNSASPTTGRDHRPKDRSKRASTRAVGCRHGRDERGQNGRAASGRRPAQRPARTGAGTVGPCDRPVATSSVKWASRRCAGRCSAATRLAPAQPPAGAAGAARCSSMNTLTFDASVHGSNGLTRKSRLGRVGGSIWSRSPQSSLGGHEDDRDVLGARPLLIQRHSGEAVGPGMSMLSRYDDDWVLSSWRSASSPTSP